MAEGSGQTVASAPGRAGRAALTVTRVQGESAVTACYATSPMRLLTPRARGTSVWAYASSFGGGMLAGDETRLDLSVGAGACCFVGTQAATKVYRSPDGIPSRHETRATLEDRALLAFAPDPVQPFAQSAYRQSQSFHLAAGASLFLLDWCSAGRVATGERWGFRSFRSRNEVWIEDRRVFLDALHLEPGGGPLAAPHQLGRFNALATLLLVGPALRDASSALLGRLRQEPVARRGDLVASASPVAGGAVLRLAAVHLEAAATELHRELAGLSHLLADDPWSRKW